MRNTLLIVASLALGTAAVAQDQPATVPAGPESTPPAPPSDASSPTPTDPAATPPSGGNMSNGSMSNGSMSGGNMGQAQQMASSTDTSNYPKCGKGVTDKCVQAGGMGGMHGTHGMHRKMMHKPK